MQIKITPTPNNKFNSLALYIEGDESKFPAALLQVRPDIDGQELARLLTIACSRRVNVWLKKESSRSKVMVGRTRG